MDLAIELKDAVEHDVNVDQLVDGALWTIPKGLLKVLNE